MSATLEQRVERWAVWQAKARAARPDMVLAGYSHWCGSANEMSEAQWQEFDGTCCDGCRHTLPYPGRECKPLYAVPDWEVYHDA